MDPVTAAYQAWTEHRFYAYRGCAPDADTPSRAAGNTALTLDAWTGTTEDGGEDQATRRERQDAAVEVCLNCPVMVQCDVYGGMVGADGKLLDPYGIRGGRTALERHRLLVKSRKEPLPLPVPAPDHELRTEQKLSVLRALAVHESPEDVARAAGMDLRTANWQRARITTQLGLSKTASRAEVLEAAVARGLLRADEVAVPAPSVVSVPGGRRGARGRRVASVPGQLSFFEAGPALGAAA
ncbi:hypothetical protein [Streptomyces osmaniensis]|nr:hypothetical protein KJK32_46860 [Streptomyces sp. JCM17656]